MRITFWQSYSHKNSEITKLLSCTWSAPESEAIAHAPPVKGIALLVVFELIKHAVELLVIQIVRWRVWAQGRLASYVEL